MDALAYGTIFVALTAVFIVLKHAYNFGVERISMRMRVACMALVFRKVGISYLRVMNCLHDLINFAQVLKLSQGSISKRTSGNIVNIMSSDCEKLLFMWKLLVYIVVGPLTLVMVALLSYIEMGYSALVGLGVVFIIFPFKGCNL